MKKLFIVSVAMLCLANVVYAIDYSWTPKEGYSIDYKIVRSMKDPVLYNKKSGIYHEIDCEWARKCTYNCVYLERSEAMRLGRQCKVCR